VIGKKIEHFKILEELGGGGMGIVYKAEDTKLRTTVALKFLPPELTRDKDAKKRLEHEAQALAALDHPNICTVHSLHEAPDGRMFFCMAYYDGQTLGERLAEGPLPVRDALQIAVSVAAGLERAHGKNVVHRDVKPGNIMITGEGTLKIMDFGIAKLAHRTRVTAEGTMPGTIFYMSPEQFTGLDVDGRSDIFSLGAVLYEMLTGHAPFEADHQNAIYYKILHEQPKPLAHYRSDVPKGLQRIIDKALQKDREDRYQTAAQFEADLKSVLGGRQPHPVLRRALMVTAAALVVGFVTWKSIEHIKPDVPTEQRVLVLPFTSVDVDASESVMIDGLYETLTEQLTQLEQFGKSLWVVPTADMRRRDFADPGEAAGIFGVNLLVSADVRRVADDFLIELDLVDADGERSLRAAEITCRSEDITRLQRDVVMRVAEMLGVDVSADALAVLTVGGTVVPAAYESYLEGCGSLVKEEDGAPAAERFERAIAADSGYARAYHGLGKACRKQYDASGDDPWVENGVIACRRALEIDPGLSPVYVTLGEVYSAGDNSEGAIEAFRQALAFDALNSSAYRGLAKAYGALGRLEEAETTYKKAIERKPDYWPAHQDLGYFYYPRGRYEDAAAQFEVLLELTPGHYMTYNNLGAFYYLLGRTDEARRLWEESFAIKKSYSSCMNLGTLYYRAGRYADAVRMYEWAVEFDDPSIDYKTWGNLASAYYWAPGERHKAWDKYRIAIDLAEQERKENPNDPIVLAFLAGYYADVGDGARSRVLIQEALRVAPKNAEVVFRAGHAYEKLGDREKALVWIGNAIDQGYSQEEIRQDPGLKELREDVRFKLLLPETGAE
jgi:tetratricopeptide (TPR) repeat protein/TolB-like protein